MVPWQRGSIEGHWTTRLGIVESVDEGKAFVCKLWLSSGKERHRATFRSASNASNLYSHLKLIQSDVHAILTPVIHARDKNKREKKQVTTITDIIAKTQQRTLDEALLCFFAAPDVPQTLFESKRFENVLRAINANVKISTKKTLAFRLWDKLNDTILRIN